jgi:hypothetical protein
MSLGPEADPETQEEHETQDEHETQAEPEMQAEPGSGPEGSTRLRQDPE